MDGRSRSLISGCSTVVALIFACIWIWNTYTHHRGAGLIDEGNKLMNAGNPASVQKAIKDFKDAEESFKGNADEKINVGICEYDLGLAYEKAGQDEQARDAFTSALPILQGVSDQKDEVTTIHNSLGQIYFRQGQADSKAGKLPVAITSYEQAAASFKDGGDTENTAASYNNVGVTAFNLGLADVKKQDWKSAIGSFQQSQTGFHQAGKKSDEADAFHQIALCDDASGKSSEAATARQQEQALRS